MSSVTNNSRSVTAAEKSHLFLLAVALGSRKQLNSWTNQLESTGRLAIPHIYYERLSLAEKHVVDETVNDLPFGFEVTNEMLIILLKPLR